MANQTSETTTTNHNHITRDIKPGALAQPATATGPASPQPPPSC
jgi:hypothetical protein